MFSHTGCQSFTKRSKVLLTKGENMKEKVKQLSRLILQTKITLAFPFSSLTKKKVQKTFLIASPMLHFAYILLESGIEEYL